MKTPIWAPKIIHSDDEFTYVLSFLPEDVDAKEHFIVECGWSSQEFTTINSSYWFIADITAYKGKIACGTASLGGNCYSSLKEVLNPYNKQSVDISDVLSGYAPQMIEEARERAIKELIRLHNL